MRRLILVLAMVGVAVLLASGAALGITGGLSDTTEPYKYPYVGALVGTFDDDENLAYDPNDQTPPETYTYCTGTLISPTVLLTAAHCDPSTGDAVTFDAKFDPDDPSDPEDPSSTLYSICRGDAACSKDDDHDGNPDFDGRFRADPNGYDIAVVVFFDPPFGDPPKLDNGTPVTLAQLPSRLHQFDRVAKNQKFTAVGYGEQGATSTVYDTRTYAVSTFKSVSEDYLRLSQNLNQGDGGTCYGDSGGPNFVGEYPYDYDNNPATENVPTIASITNTGDPWCKATNVTLRLDNEAAYDFLSRPFLDGHNVKLPSRQ